MDTDVSSLLRRVKRLELLLGPVANEGNHPGLRTQLSTAAEELRSLVPDEAAAAQRALTLLSTTAGTSTCMLEARLSTTTQLVQRALPQLSHLDSLISESDDCHVPPIISTDHFRTLAKLSQRARNVRCDQDHQDTQVDHLLAAFDSATARLNAAIHILANQVRALSPSSIESPPSTAEDNAPP